MLLNQIAPSVFLARYIRFYRIIDFRFDSNIDIPVKLYSPRPEHCLQFYPKDTEQVSYPDSAVRISDKRVTLVGQHTVLQHRQIGHEFLSLQVVFQPAALFQLTGIPMKIFCNIYADASDIFGKSVDEVNEQLHAATSYTGMIAIVELFLAKLIKRSSALKTGSRPIGISAATMLAEEDRFSIDVFLRQSYLSHRQFDRLFNEQIGLAPKQFLQVIRFDKAYRMKNRKPDMDWLTVALHCGYHDYQHLAKEYKQFTGYTPAKFFALDNNAPERNFGEAET